MARPTWSGSISFGLVSVPVELYTVVRSHAIRFNQLHRATKAPVKQKRVDAKTGDEVSYSQIVKGYDVGDGRMVVADPKELEELDPRASRLICIHAFVEQGDIDPVFYDRPYFLTPDGEGAKKPYRLLSEAMERTAKVAIATFVMRHREYLAVMRAREGLLVLSTMHDADEVADPADLDVDLGGAADLSDAEVGMAMQLIGSMLTDFVANDYHDEHRKRVVEYLEAKGEGRPIEIQDEDRTGENVVDLMAALEQSVSRSRDGATAISDDADRYERMTRRDLYEVARERELPGRSSLSKAELVEALRCSDQQQDVA